MSTGACARHAHWGLCKHEHWAVHEWDSVLFREGEPYALESYVAALHEKGGCEGTEQRLETNLFECVLFQCVRIWPNSPAAGGC